MRLAHINRELDTNFQLDQFRHTAIYNGQSHRIEMHLISLRRQTVLIDGVPITFNQGERILTECSYKYSLEAFAVLAYIAGWRVRRVWTDPRNLFSVHYLSPLVERR